jgi:hypothetical protein
MVISSNMNFIGKYVSMVLAVALFSANGFLTAVSLSKNHHQGAKKISMQMCSCCAGGDGMPCACCCTQHQSRTFTSCEFSSAPCTNPVTAVSPNVLDPAVQTQFAQHNILFDVKPERFPSSVISLLSGIQNSLFHPPQSSPFVFS